MISEKMNSAATLHTPTRRQVMASVAIAFGSLAAGSRVWGQTQQPAMKEVPATAANQTRTSLHEEADFKATPQRVYDVLLDAKQFAACTGLPAEIDPKAGGTFSLFGGLIVGLNVELLPAQRIVQAWRPTHWDPGIYSIVRFELKPRGAEATMVLDHTGFPEGEFDHLDSGWKSHYCERLKKYLT